MVTLRKSNAQVITLKKHLMNLKDRCNLQSSPCCRKALPLWLWFFYRMEQHCTRGLPGQRSTSFLSRSRHWFSKTFKWAFHFKCINSPTNFGEAAVHVNIFIFDYLQVPCNEPPEKPERSKVFFWRMALAARHSKGNQMFLKLTLTVSCDSMKITYDFYFFFNSLKS